MRHGKRRSPAKQLATAILIALILAVPGMLFGGVVAYLSASANEVTNTLQLDAAPVVIVNADRTAVTVKPREYPVYIRVKAVANKMNGDNIVITDPPITCSVSGLNWFSHNEFWYYQLPVSASVNDVDIPVTVTPSVTGSDIKVDLIAQAIQAVGTTDADNIPAVTASWGIEIDANKNLVDPS